MTRYDDENDDDDDDDDIILVCLTKCLTCRAE
jgi:hypothetical protein